jgi:hypothetical protein
VADVLVMPALELRNPVALGVLVEADDAPCRTAPDRVQV